MNTSFDDMPNDLDGGDDFAPVNMAAAAAPRYTSTCSKCRGRGRFISYTGRDCGPCFTCKGTGKLQHKTSPDQRAKARDQAAARKDAAQRAALEDFAATHPSEYGWLTAKADRFDFAANLLDALRRYGSLTENQLAAVQRCQARDAERAAVATIEAAKSAPSADLTALHAVLQRHAKFYAGELTISRRNADQLCWIKHENAEKVVGKIDNGKLTLWNRPGVDMNAVRSMLDEFNGAPLQTAMKYGKLAGRCCSCGRELTNDGSIEAGIGPICAGKFQ
jgi:hypothetical protein